MKFLEKTVFFYFLELSKLALLVFYLISKIHKNIGISMDLSIEFLSSSVVRGRFLSVFCCKKLKQTPQGSVFLS